MAVLGLASGWGVQAAASTPRIALADHGGVLRWEDTGEEVALFGVNYTSTFAYGYLALGYLGASREQTIDQDLSHLARMGLDGLRLCLWGDWELTDRDGNLADSEHLRLTDYMIAQASARGLYVLLTPIVTYSSRWPEPEEDRTCHGFSTVYNKDQLATDPEARQAQVRYLHQLMDHVNPYTHCAYKDEPAILAVELINEPISPSAQGEILDYVNDLARAVRDTGCRKPLFYNASQGMWEALVNALRESSVEGVTFAWYPTGLLSGHSLRGNFLPTVDDYPEMRDPALASKAKLVYEFDAADVPGSHMYPAMARAFRAGGAQWATMFGYDPLPLAATNAEYQTHYLNLVYTPNKAISLLIANEAFHRLPGKQSYGRYPDNTRFGPFRVSYEEDLSEMVTEREFLYSNDTQTRPLAPELLDRVVGCGSSPVVDYEGMGSYFLEKLEAGIWRLEVYPDAVWVNDPHGRPCLDREVSRIIWRSWPMQLRLPDLGERFTVSPLNKGNNHQAKSQEGRFVIRPGVYLLLREGIATGRWSAERPFGRLKLGEFVAPADEHKPPVVLPEPVKEITKGEPLRVQAQVVSSELPDEVTLWVRSLHGKEFRPAPMVRTRGYRWAAEFPGEVITTGAAEYCVSVRLNGRVRTYPADVPGEPGQPGFALPAPVLLYAPHAGDAPPSVTCQGASKITATAHLAPGSQPGATALVLSASNLVGHAAAKVSLPGRSDDAIGPTWAGDTAVVVSARGTVTSGAVALEIDERNGPTYVCDLPVTPAWHRWRIPLREFRPLTGLQTIRQFDISRLNALRLVMRQWPGGSGARDAARDEVQVESVSLEPGTPLWVTQALPGSDRVTVFDVARDYDALERSAVWGYREKLVMGATDGKLALSVSSEGRNGWYPEVALRHWFGDPLGTRSGRPSPPVRALWLTARAERSPVDVQIALGDDRGSTIGRTVRLTTDWQTLRLPLSDFARIMPLQVPHPWPLPLSMSGTAGLPPVTSGLSTLFLSLRPEPSKDKVVQPITIDVQEVALETCDQRGDAADREHARGEARAGGRGTRLGGGRDD